MPMTIEVDRDIMSIDDILDIMHRCGNFKSCFLSTGEHIRAVEVGYTSGQYLRVMRGVSINGVKAKIASEFYHTLSRKCVTSP